MVICNHAAGSAGSTAPLVEAHVTSLLWPSELVQLSAGNPCSNVLPLHATTSEGCIAIYVTDYSAKQPSAPLCNCRPLRRSCRHT
jgi:hypothetical protein